MELFLPKKSSRRFGNKSKKAARGSRQEVIRSNRIIATILGPNGSGKTTFAKKIISGIDPKRAYRINSLNSMFVSEKADELPYSIDSQYDRIMENESLLRDDARTQLERMVKILLHEEMKNLAKFKLDVLEEKTPKELQVTKLDRLFHEWQNIFPGNKILLREGKLLVKGGSKKKEYSSIRLSNGEKAVLYYIGAALLAPENSFIFVDDPTQFLHPSIQNKVWNRIEAIRSDCSFIFTTHDIEFSASQIDSTTIWVNYHDWEDDSWDYSILPSDMSISEKMYASILGERKPVLFIEGDENHSIDSRLYPLIFSRFAVKPLGSCDKVIETVRSFNDLQEFHHTDCYGIVDRDRRSDEEVESLRKRKIFVPDVAEIENILMLEDVVKAVALRYRPQNEENKRDADRAYYEKIRNMSDEEYANDIFKKVKGKIVALFADELEAQVLEHTRHRIKRRVQTVIDYKATSLDDIKNHLDNLLNKTLNVDGTHKMFHDDFVKYRNSNDYASILKVFNHKQMISQSCVASIIGVPNNICKGKENNQRNCYVAAIIAILRGKSKEADMIRNAIEHCFKIHEISTITKK